MAEVNKYNGIILVNKPAQWTSFDVVGKLRGVLGMKKIGHAGTLDPMATGVLPVFLGKATRACDILPSEEKAYRAGFKFGVTTDTLDVTGKILSTSDKKCSRDEVVETAKNFVGDVMQIPPMYSAVKVNGQKLCNLARQGITVERKAREVHIDCIDVLSFDEESQSGEMFVSCKKGTYIRTVIDDIGQTLGCGAVMTSLVRENSSGFKLCQCFTIDEIVRLCNEGRIGEIIIDTKEAFCGVYKNVVRLDEKLTGLYKNGVKLAVRQLDLKNCEEYEDENLIVYGFNEEFLGLGRIDVCKGELRSVKNFY